MQTILDHVDTHIKSNGLAKVINDEGKLSMIILVNNQLSILRGLGSITTDDLMHKYTGGGRGTSLLTIQYGNYNCSKYQLT